MIKYAAKITKTLYKCIEELNEMSDLFVKRPGKDFTRNRKLSFSKITEILMTMGGSALNRELLMFHDYDEKTSTASAFIQQRQKILPEAFAYLLKVFTNKLDNIKTFQGFRVLAVDGSDVNIPLNPDDPDTYVATKKTKGYNLMHINALYDVCNKLYLDVIIQPNKKRNETSAMVDMIDRTEIDGRVLVIADRGYKSYNVMAHAEKKGWFYLIRTHGPDKSSAILSGKDLPVDEEFDVDMLVRLYYQQTKKAKEDEHYRYLSKYSRFDYLSKESRECYSINFRAVCVEVEKGKYQYFLTNLPSNEISKTMIKTFYHMRWGVEISFRELKHTIGLTHFHSKKAECIKQEIYARMVMYNFCEAITLNVIVKQKARKHLYQVNFTMAIHICKEFFRRSKNAHPPNIEALIQKYILPVRMNRKYPRKVRFRSCVSFLYRVA